MLRRSSPFARILVGLGISALMHRCWQLRIGRGLGLVTHPCLRDTIDSDSSRAVELHRYRVSKGIE